MNFIVQLCLPQLARNQDDNNFILSNLLLKDLIDFSNTK